jgi:hypothetical protein
LAWGHNKRPYPPAIEAEGRKLYPIPNFLPIPTDPKPSTKPNRHIVVFPPGIRTLEQDAALYYKMWEGTQILFHHTLGNAPRDWTQTEPRVPLKVLSKSNEESLEYQTL